MLRATLCSALLFCATTTALGQGLGNHLNFEAPMHRAIAVATIASGSYLLVCNAQDNSVEVYTAANPPVFLLRVPVGQEPVTVAVKPTPLPDGSRVCYAACWLGDSIAKFT